MKSHYRSHNYFHLLTIISIIFSISLSSCNIFSQSSSAIEVIPFTETIENYPQAEIIFQVHIPNPISDEERLVLEIIDDVTGIYFNPLHYEMIAQDAQNYFVRLPFTVGSIIKYRFLRQGTQSIYESTTQNKEVHQRILIVDGSMLVQDSIATWADQMYSGPVGRIRGQLIDATSNTPIPNMSINAAGIQTLSASDGTFILEGLPVWTHNVVITSLDGVYEPFQQGAAIAEEATTPIFLSLQKRETVDIIFEVKVPDGFETDLPLRFASNLYSLGFSDVDLSSGSSMVSSNLPVFTRSSANTYSLLLTLPVGTNIRYKFTFGDGFWNAELSDSGNFITRELIVPSLNTTIKKKMEAIQSPNYGEIVFNLTVPANTPANDQVSIQLSPFGWMQPLPMVKTGENQWRYTLYSPIHLLGNIGYRFCRNDRCDIAISNETQENIFTGTSSSQNITINLDNWKNLDLVSNQTMVDTSGVNVQPRTDFIAGFEIISDFPDAWSTSIDQGLQSLNQTGANWVILSPTWSETSINPPLFEPIPGTDLLWPDLISVMTKITNEKLQPVLFPQLSSSISKDQFWSKAERGSGWWQSLFERYHRFIMQNADLANLFNASALLIGDPAMRPAMSGGTLENGDPSKAPDYSDEQWSQLINDIRARFNGPVIGVVSIPDQNDTLPGWLKDVDGIYVLFSPTLTDVADQSNASLMNSFNTSLDSLVLPIATQYNRPIIIGINYPSTQTALTGCTDINGSCKEINYEELADFTIDLDLQAKIYNAAIISCVNRPWINGFISRGFDPTVIIQDQSSSLYGKPASDVIWFWYHFILNKPS